MTPKLREFLLHTHNDLRNRLAGGQVEGYESAVRMASMSWDNEFEYLSALNLLQCYMAHDKCRRTPNYPYVGQNLAYLKWSHYDFELEEVLLFLIEYWFEEKKYMTMNDIKTMPRRPDK